MEILIFEKKCQPSLKNLYIWIVSVYACPKLEKTYALVGVNLWFGWRKPMVCSMTDDTFF